MSADGATDLTLEVSSSRPRDRARRLAALLRKETFQIVRDPSSLLIAFALPLILLFLFGYGISLDATSTRIGLVMERATPTAIDLAASFRGSTYFEVVVGRDRREFDGDFVLGRVKGIVVIPSTFGADYAGGVEPEIQVIVDGSEPNTASFVQSYAEGVVATWNARRAADVTAPSPAITVEQRVWFNPELTSRNFLVPGAIAIVMTMVGTLLTSLVVAREWERGTMEAIMATPASAAELLVGKLLPYFVLGLVAMTMCVLVAVFLFGVPFRGSIVALYLLSIAFLIPTLGQGLLISAIAKDQFLASQIALILGFLPAFLLSGFLYEITSMPVVIRWLTYLFPARYFIPSIQTVFLAGDIWPIFAPAIAVLLLMGAGLMALAWRSMRKRIV